MSSLKAPKQVGLQLIRTGEVFGSAYQLTASVVYSTLALPVLSLAIPNPQAIARLGLLKHLLSARLMPWAWVDGRIPIFRVTS